MFDRTSLGRVKNVFCSQPILDYGVKMIFLKTNKYSLPPPYKVFSKTCSGYTIEPLGDSHDLAESAPESKQNGPVQFLIRNKASFVLKDKFVSSK